MLEATDRQNVNKFSVQIFGVQTWPISSRVVVGGRVVVVVVGNTVVVVSLSFFFPFLSALGFLVAFGALGSFCFFLSFFFFLSSFAALFILPTTPGKVRTHQREVP